MSLSFQPSPTRHLALSRLPMSRLCPLVLTFKPSTMIIIISLVLVLTSVWNDVKVRHWCDFFTISFRAFFAFMLTLALSFKTLFLVLLLLLPRCLPLCYRYLVKSLLATLSDHVSVLYLLSCSLYLLTCDTHGIHIKLTYRPTWVPTKYCSIHSTPPYLVAIHIQPLKEYGSTYVRKSVCL